MTETPKDEFVDDGPDYQEDLHVDQGIVEDDTDEPDDPGDIPPDEGDSEAVRKEDLDG
jgi:hypothetical protein